MAKDGESLPTIGLKIEYQDSADLEPETVVLSPQAIIQTEDHFKKGIQTIMEAGRMGYLMYLAWRQIRISRPGNSQVDFNKWVATTQAISIDAEDEEDEDPTEPDPD